MENAIKSVNPKEELNQLSPNLISRLKILIQAQTDPNNSSRLRSSSSYKKVNLKSTNSGQYYDANNRTYADITNNPIYNEIVDDCSSATNENTCKKFKKLYI